MADLDIHGVVVPVITPIDKDENLDEKAFRALISFLIDSGVHGIFVGGSAGEGPLLDYSQWVRMAQTAFDEVGGRVPLMGGTMDTSTRRVVDRIRVLRDIGFRAMVVTPTFYITVKTHDEHMRFFGTAKEACGDAEMVAYNIPSCTYSTIGIETVCEMTRRGWIRYCKESGGDIAYFGEVLTKAGDLGLKILMGDEVILSETLKMGAVGAVPVIANYEPKTLIDLYNAAVDKDYDKLQQMHERLQSLREIILKSGTSWVAGAKYAVSTLGFGEGLPLSPLQPAEEERRRRINAIERRSS